MNLALHLERAGREDSQRPALGQGTRVLRTYGEVADRVARLAGALQRFGLAPGDRVVIAAKNSPDYLEVLYAIWHAGFAAVPANSKLHGAELGYIIEQSGSRVCFASKGLDTEIAPHAPNCLERMIVIGSAEYNKLFAADPVPVVSREGPDLAWLFYTSGTTGRPKGAMLTHKVIAAATKAYTAEVDTVAPGDPILHAAPMSHGSGLYIMAHVLHRGVNVVPESSGFEPQEIFELFRAWPRTSMFAAPTMVKRLVESSADCPSENIRTIIYGGAPMYVEDALKALDRFGPRLAQIYGQGESPMTITMLPKSELADREKPRWRERLRSAGRPYACVEVGWRMSRTARSRPEMSARFSAAATPSWPAIGRARTPLLRRCAAASCTLATSAPSTPMAISRSRIAPRT
jgi:long-chain acyl-CoA synthetase